MATRACASALQCTARHRTRGRVGMHANHCVPQVRRLSLVQLQAQLWRSRQQFVRHEVTQMIRLFIVIEAQSGISHRTVLHCTSRDQNDSNATVPTTSRWTPPPPPPMHPSSPKNPSLCSPDAARYHPLNVSRSRPSPTLSCLCLTTPRHAPESCFHHWHFVTLCLG